LLILFHLISIQVPQVVCDHATQLLLYHAFVLSVVDAR
jgi:hypothetical protein